jgi:hypothetical protein
MLFEFIVIEIDKEISLIINEGRGSSLNSKLQPVTELFFLMLFIVQLPKKV